MQLRSAKDLEVYQRAYALSLAFFHRSRDWPGNERYSLTDQIRRSSRSVCANLREAWAKRRYEAHFLSKLTDADGENAETDTWLDFAMDCGYLDPEAHGHLVAEARAIGAMLGAMIRDPSNFTSRPVPSAPRPRISDC